MLVLKGEKINMNCVSGQTCWVVGASGAGAAGEANLALGGCCWGWCGGEAAVTEALAAADAATSGSCWWSSCE